MRRRRWVELERPPETEQAEQFAARGQGHPSGAARRERRERSGEPAPDELDDDGYDDPRDDDDDAEEEEEPFEERGHDLLHDEQPGPVEVGGSEAVHRAAHPRGTGRRRVLVAFDELRKGIASASSRSLEIAAARSALSP